MPAENWFWIVFVITVLGGCGCFFWKEWRPFYVAVLIMLALLAYMINNRGPIK